MTRERWTGVQGQSRLHSIWAAVVAVALGHYVFITREPDILREIHGFVATLGKKPRQ